MKTNEKGVELEMGKTKTPQQLLAQYQWDEASKNFLEKCYGLCIFSPGIYNERLHLIPNEQSEFDGTEVNGFFKRFVYGHVVIEQDPVTSLYFLSYANTVLENEVVVEHSIVYKIFRGMEEDWRKDRKKGHWKRKRIATGDVDYMIKLLEFAMYEKAEVLL